MKTWLLVPCQGSRSDVLARFLKSVEHPPHQTVVVTTTLDTVPPDYEKYSYRLVLPWSGVHHLSFWWNQGLDMIDDLDPEDHVVVAASSDTVGRPDSLDLLAGELVDRDWVMAGPNWHGQDTYPLPEERSVIERVPGACWAVRGHRPWRCDEDFRWWYTDDDFETILRQHGEVGLVGGTGLVQGEPDSYMSAAQAEAATADRARYVAKWGKEPW
jgi:hypothetical protein